MIAQTPEPHVPDPRPYQPLTVLNTTAFIAKTWTPSRRLHTPTKATSLALGASADIRWKSGGCPPRNLPCSPAATVGAFAVATATSNLFYSTATTSEFGIALKSCSTGSVPTQRTPSSSLSPIGPSFIYLIVFVMLNTSFKEYKASNTIPRH